MSLDWNEKVFLGVCVGFEAAGRPVGAFQGRKHGVRGNLSCQQVEAACRRVKGVCRLSVVLTRTEFVLVFMLATYNVLNMCVCVCLCQGWGFYLFIL